VKLPTNRGKPRLTGAKGAGQLLLVVERQRLGLAADGHNKVRVPVGVMLDAVAQPDEELQVLAHRVIGVEPALLGTASQLPTLVLSVDLDEPSGVVLLPVAIVGLLGG
jgi:hypothetical protein